MYSLFWLVAIIGGSVAIIVLARWVNKRNILRGRKPANIEEIYRQNAVRLDVSYELFERVFNAIGKVYRIDPKLLRPTDKLKQFYNLDSWEIGEGTETLNEMLEKDFGIIHFEIEPQTIAELVVEIQKQCKRE